MALFVGPAVSPRLAFEDPLLIEPAVLREVFRRMGAPPRPLVRFDGESYWFRHLPGQVLRVFRRASCDYVDAICRVYRPLAEAGIPYRIPEILHVDHVSGVPYVIQTGPRGRSFADVVPDLPASQRLRAARGYINAVDAASRVAAPVGDTGLPYGDMLPRIGSVRGEHWRTYLHQKLVTRLRYVGANVRRSIGDFGGVAAKVLDRIDLLPIPATATIVRAVPGGTGVFVDSRGMPTWIDGIGGRTVAGDHRLDLVCAALTVQEVCRLNRQESKEIWKEVYNRMGSGAESCAETYRLYLGLLNLEYYSRDPRVFQWAVRALEMGIVSPRSASPSR